MVNEVEVRIETPTPEEHQRLRVIAGMPKRSDSGTVKGLANTLYGVCLYKDDHMVGMGRVVGDGGMVFHLVDIVVDPDCQGLGLGKLIVEQLMDWILQEADETAIISLIADIPADGLYRQFGFDYSRPESVGMEYQWNRE
ncbi:MULTISPECIES: GNAT family N-acetyltransferase [Exiguobacterium]|jgi:GNAT superfamily N-acetyltransferase|uniref:GNAT family N-acetyltransferase n=1 Tax=Exiguobacterium TaxID=33986 RepID=UPI0004966975|nr:MULTISPECIES: GNAT family N-acetyltransferase [Exiguobacterium]KAB2860976.1 MAG: GNAT family N-acetyltransferase [Exiguobacterium chiriqhucha]KDN58535.1 GNAT family acetyltransferase [Exiguobacterium sp. AB2]TCI72436.1 N-acetyltransferase [Exiguobacterium sp. IPCI3]TCI81834.1 N-acetyltransferase [Exiguobacterium sp. IPCH1]TCI83340.1 N-acetyltransferase [Exiguobacterium sp. IPBC4]